MTTLSNSVMSQQLREISLNRTHIHRYYGDINNMTKGRMR